MKHRVRSTGARASLGFLVPNCDIALSPEVVVTLSRANRAAQDSGIVCFGAGKTPALDIPQGRRSSAPDHTAKATSRAAATTLERLWEPLGAAIGHDELFNGQLRINVSDLVPHLDHLAALLCLTRGATCYVDAPGSGPCTISLPIGPDGEAIRVQCEHCALCCPTDAREALQVLEGSALSSPLPAVRVCMARGARVPGELNVTFGVDSNQGVLETARDISRRFAECSEQRQVQGLAARKSADPSEWQGWKVEVQTRGSAFAQLERASRKRCSRDLMVQVSVSRATSSFECPDIPLVPRATPDELKAAAKRKRDELDAFDAHKAKRDEPDALAARKAKRDDPDAPSSSGFEGSSRHPSPTVATTPLVYARGLAPKLYAVVQASSNGKVERFIGTLSADTRAILAMSKVPNRHWHWAMRHKSGKFDFPMERGVILDYGGDGVQYVDSMRLILGYIVLLADGTVNYSRHVQIDERELVAGGIHTPWKVDIDSFKEISNEKRSDQAPIPHNFREQVKTTTGTPVTANDSQGSATANPIQALPKGHDPLRRDRASRSKAKTPELASARAAIGITHKGVRVTLPCNFRQARASPNADKWREAMESNLEAHRDLNTFNENVVKADRLTALEWSI
ncbi:hypothetical protein T492DRAFT_913111 [Pavlovales sp. CCMP2436]|nr:hypothetical protein T492DRAFT_913111 [Pavlovales sp. CCMP2436]